MTVATGDSVRCRLRTRGVERWAAASVTLQAGLVVWTFVSPGAATRPAAELTGLGIVWLVALALHVANYRLIRCGNQALRLELAPSPVNRPGIVYRAFFHALINWSAVATTLVVAARVRDAALSTGLAALCALATLAVWTTFNVMHRRMNRLRNLALSTAFAAALLGVAARLIADSL